MAIQLRRDYYEVLGIGPEADGDGIKRAFRSHARRLHPDVSEEPDAESRFVELVEAYEVLSNPRSRLLYDHLGFGRWRRAFVSAPPRPQEGAAVVVVAEVELEHWQALAGHTVPLQYTRERPCEMCAGSGADPVAEQVTCDDCSGSGYLRTRVERADFHHLQLVKCTTCGGKGLRPAVRCAECAGSGRVAGVHRVKLAVPAGVADGDSLRVEGIDGVVRLAVRPKPRERRVVRLVATTALLAALGLLAYLLVT
jgi:molecular chaperone DnaJ